MKEAGAIDGDVRERAFRFFRIKASCLESDGLQRTGSEEISGSPGATIQNHDFMTQRRSSGLLSHEKNLENQK